MTWTLNPNATHFRIYWNVRLQTHVCLNGSKTPFENYTDGDISDDIEVGFDWLRPRDWVLRN